MPDDRIGPQIESPHICSWCRDGDHDGCIGDSDPYGPDCTCTHGIEPQIDTALVIYDDDEREPTPRGIDRRNIAIIGAPDAGCSTLTERMVRDAE